MTFDEMDSGLKDFERTKNLLDHMADRIAGMLVGRLRNVDSPYTLRQLKRELRDYNPHTNRWMR